MTVLLEPPGALSSSSSYVVERQQRDQGDTGAAPSRQGLPGVVSALGSPQT